VQLVTRAGNNFASRFPLITAAIAALPVRSCVVDGEAIACNENGLSVFDLLHYQRRDQVVTLCAFDLLLINGEDVRRESIEDRSADCPGLLRRPHDGIALNEHYKAPVRSSIATHARSVARALSASGLARPTALAARRIG
jgi:bifunctional non-homologous end joining protein LigD